MRPSRRDTKLAAQRIQADSRSITRAASIALSGARRRKPWLPTCAHQNAEARTVSSESGLGVTSASGPGPGTAAPGDHDAVARIAEVALEMLPTSGPLSRDARAAAVSSAIRQWTPITRSLPELVAHMLATQGLTARSASSSESTREPSLTTHEPGRDGSVMVKGEDVRPRSSADTTH